MTPGLQLIQQAAAGCGDLKCLTRLQTLQQRLDTSEQDLTLVMVREDP